jgi:hypothetical protein
LKDKHNNIQSKYSFKLKNFSIIFSNTDLFSKYSQQSRALYCRSHQNITTSLITGAIIDDMFNYKQLIIEGKSYDFA